ncbi:MAG: hypothetical protein RTU92_00810 [Candidatus Thorarchaeota archaeon]
MLSAICSELHVDLVSLPVFISWLYQLGPFLAPDGDPTLPVFIPIPILTICVSIIIYFLAVYRTAK